MEKDYNWLQEAKYKVEGQLEILQDQLQQEIAEKHNVKQVVPHLQEAIALIESSCRVTSAAGTSGAQQTLNRISDLMREQSKFPTVLKRRHVRANLHDNSKRDSILSMFSDTSSVTESSLADEDAIQRQNIDCMSHLPTPEQNKLSADNSKPVVSDLHRSLAYSPTTSKSQSYKKDMTGDPAEPVQAMERIQECRQMLHETLHNHKHIHSESSPVMDISIPGNYTKSKPETIPRKTRHNSEPDASIKGRSQSFRQEPKAKPCGQLRRRTTQPAVHGDELSAILSKRREKVESISENTKQNLTQ